MPVNFGLRRLSPEEIATLLRKTQGGGKPGAKLQYDPAPYDEVVAGLEPVADINDKEAGWLVVDLESADQVKQTRDRLRAAAHRRDIDIQFVSAGRGAASLVFRPTVLDRQELEQKAEQRRARDNARKAAKAAKENSGQANADQDASDAVEDADGGVRLRRNDAA